MAFTLKAEGANSFDLTDDTLDSLEFENMPDGYNARDTYQTLAVSGRICPVTDGEVKDNIIGAAKWSLVPAVLHTAYQKITATAATAGQATCIYEFSLGFVVSYREKFTDQSGVGSFAMAIRQKKDLLGQVKIRGGYVAE